MHILKRENKLYEWNERGLYFWHYEVVKIHVSALYIILPETKPSNVDLKILDYKKTITLVILMILYGLTILRVGYFLSTSIFLVLSYIVLGERKWIWIFILSFPFVALFMYLLHGLLNIYLRDPFLQLIGIMGWLKEY